MSLTRREEPEIRVDIYIREILPTPKGEAENNDGLFVYSGGVRPGRICLDSLLSDIDDNGDFSGKMDWELPRDVDLNLVSAEPISLPDSALIRWTDDDLAYSSVRPEVAEIRVHVPEGENTTQSRRLIYRANGNEFRVIEEETPFPSGQWPPVGDMPIILAEGPGGVHWETGVGNVPQVKMTIVDRKSQILVSTEAGRGVSWQKESLRRNGQVPPESLLLIADASRRLCRVETTKNFSVGWTESDTTVPAPPKYRQGKPAGLRPIGTSQRAVQTHAPDHASVGVRYVETFSTAHGRQYLEARIEKDPDGVRQVTEVKRVAPAPVDNKQEVTVMSVADRRNWQYLWGVQSPQARNSYDFSISLINQSDALGENNRLMALLMGQIWKEFPGTIAELEQMLFQKFDYSGADMAEIRAVLEENFNNADFEELREIRFIEQLEHNMPFGQPEHIWQPRVGVMMSSGTKNMRIRRPLAPVTDDVYQFSLGLKEVGESVVLAMEDDVVRLKIGNTQEVTSNTLLPESAALLVEKHSFVSLSDNGVRIPSIVYDSEIQLDISSAFIQDQCAWYLGGMTMYEGERNIKLGRNLGPRKAAASVIEM